MVIDVGCALESVNDGQKHQPIGLNCMSPDDTGITGSYLYVITTYKLAMLIVQSLPIMAL